ncbi:uncharacterized protein C6orf10 homolog [Pteropus vampyrus]|uniref:Uncharacterized protein C6orf10 homolog n=1 Tax=Pteropus vampyrus TaxID=132908 RepID=A0A6P6BV85_PTEVA|nr:uncharacterized protein C6orf10 homolog [Pteropus vampyrus]
MDIFVLEITLAVILTLLGLAILAILLTRWTRRKQNEIDVSRYNSEQSAGLLDYEDGRGFRHSYSTESDTSYDDRAIGPIAAVDSSGKITLSPVVIFPGYMDGELTKKSVPKAPILKSGTTKSSRSSQEENKETLTKELLFTDSDESLTSVRKTGSKSKAKGIELEKGQIIMEVKVRESDTRILKTQEAQVKKSKAGIPQEKEAQVEKSEARISQKQEAHVEESEAGIPQGQEAQIERRESGIPHGQEAQVEKSKSGIPQGQEAQAERSESGIPKGQEAQVKKSEAGLPQIQEVQVKKESSEDQREQDKEKGDAKKNKDTKQNDAKNKKGDEGKDKAKGKKEPEAKGKKVEASKKGKDK